MLETSMVGKPKPSILNRCENQAFLIISILNFSLLSSPMFVLLFENMLPKSNAYTNIGIIACFFLIGHIFIILLSAYLENTRRNFILCVKMLLLKKKLHVLISMIVVKNEMNSSGK